jgi:hypothetical protein
MKQRLTKFASKPGQAMVEFALTATLLFFLLSAVIDIGLIFFTLQGLHNAAQEGATYGSRNLELINGVMTVNQDKVRDRARHEAGDRGVGFANLLDLNANGIDDATEPPTVLQSYITVMQLKDTDNNGSPLNDGVAPNYTPCPNPSSSTEACYLRVTVSLDYNFLFPFAPAFGSQIKLTSPFEMQIRDGFSQGSP